jgi:glycosyltransferase involved in cell wall biosynthesis
VRTLVFVVLYEGASHIESVLGRLPAVCWDPARYHVLIADDCSSDDSAAIAGRWLQEHGIANATVLRNPVNQGYGGNQKLGYRYALDRGFDLVVLLHGDGQYAPELVPYFVEVFEREGADVILGSRLQSLRSAARGGMPLYKIVGNRLLTGFQNRVTGAGLSEYHTGYRAYSRRFLERVPFELDTNDFHFDTEILLQAQYVGAKIAEFPIPTHYGDEICRVPGLRYAGHVMAATLRYRLHRLGMLCSLRYRDLAPERYLDKTWMPYSSHTRALARVHAWGAREVLDLGCGPGHVARECERLGVRVTAVDRVPPALGAASRFVEHDLEAGPPPLAPSAFDVVLLLDVLEHLAEPELFLLALRARSASAPGGQSPRVVITTPNVAFVAVRLNLLLGRFNYAERGILDITHRRLFTKRSLLVALEECGYDVEEVEGIGVPFQAVLSGGLGRVLGWLADRLAGFWPSLFAFQLLVVCRPRPGLGQLLAESRVVLETETAATGEEITAGAVARAGRFD